jgi:hypothetical protein
MANFVIAFLLNVSFLHISFGIQTNESKSKDEKTLPVTVKVEATNRNLISHATGSFFQIEGELGTIPAGSPVEIIVLLKNASTKPIKFSGIEKHCSCTDLGVSANEIPPNSEIVMTAQATLPELANNVTGAFQFALIDENKNRVVNLMLNYSIGAMLKFQSNQVLLEVPYGKEFQDVFVPLILTSPIELKNLSTNFDSDIRDLLFKLETSSSGVPGLLVTVNRQVVADGPVYGKVSCEDSLTGRTSSFQLSVRARQPINIAPTILWFREKNEGAGEKQENSSTVTFGANAILSIDGNLLNENQEEDGDGVEISVSAEEFPEVKQKVQKVKPNLFRVSLSIEVDTSQMEKISDVLGELNWKVQYAKGKVFRVQSRCGLER